MRNQNVALELSVIPQHIRQYRITNGPLAADIQAFGLKLSEPIESFTAAKAKASNDANLSQVGCAVKIREARDTALATFDAERDRLLLDIENRLGNVRNAMVEKPKTDSDQVLTFLREAEFRQAIAQAFPAQDERDRWFSTIAADGTNDAAYFAVLNGPQGFRLCADDVIAEAEQKRLQRLFPELSEQTRQLSAAQKIMRNVAENLREELTSVG